MLNLAVLLDTPGVVQDASFASPPPLPSAELELQLASLHLDDSSHAPHVMYAEDAPPCAEDSGAGQQEASECGSENEDATAGTKPMQDVDERISDTLIIRRICRFIGESYQRKFSPLKWTQERVQTCRRILATPRYFHQAAADLDTTFSAQNDPANAITVGAPSTQDLVFFHKTVTTNFFLPQDQSMLDNIQLVFLVLLRRSSSVVANPYVFILLACLSLSLCCNGLGCALELFLCCGRSFLDAISDPLSIRVLCDLLYHAHPKIRFESAWVLTNIASGTTDQITKLNTPATFARVLTPLLDSDVDVCGCHEIALVIARNLSAWNVQVLIRVLLDSDI